MTFNNNPSSLSSSSPLPPSWLDFVIMPTQLMNYLQSTNTALNHHHELLHQFVDHLCISMPSNNINTNITKFYMNIDHIAIIFLFRIIYTSIDYFD